MPLDELVVDGLATYRLTHLIVDDSIAAPVRSGLLRFARALGGAPLQEEAAELLSCYWCAGMWISAGVMGARALAPRAWRPAAAALALSAITGMLAERI